jgi:hypothetical protein
MPSIYFWSPPKVSTVEYALCSANSFTTDAECNLLALRIRSS